jgi:hypothetical protein
MSVSIYLFKTFYIYSTDGPPRKIWIPLLFAICQNPHWWSSIILSMYAVNLDRRMLDKILYVTDNSDIPW